MGELWMSGTQSELRAKRLTSAESKMNEGLTPGRAKRHALKK
jgi:hypothetical protein